jgi:hypothetical protein
MGALARMTAPVLQMFPEVEGYTAAVPSKRDLQALLRAVQEEVTHAVLEGDPSLVRVVAKEALKAVRLLLTKVEGMVSTGLESTRIQQNKEGGYVKTNQQEHNTQLLLLLSQLTDFVDKLPAQIIMATKDSPSFSLSRLLLGGAGSDGGGAAAGAAGGGEAVLREEMQAFLRESIRGAQELAGRQLLQPLVEALALHFRHLLLGLLKEGVAAAPAAGKSKTLAALLDQFPRAVETYLQTSASSSSSSAAAAGAQLPVPVATQELCARLVLTYTSVAALRRPVSEQSRLLTASEISAVDLLVSGLLPPGLGAVLPGLAELRSFRRLLFDPLEQEEGRERSQVLCAPRPSRVLALPYLMSLRPSTVLNYLIACGPRQLPSVADSPSEAASSGAEAGTAISGKGKGKGKSSLDSLILSSDATAAYIKMITTPSTGPGAGEGAAFASGEGAGAGDGGEDSSAELLLGASVSLAFSHSTSGSWNQVRGGVVVRCATAVVLCIQFCTSNAMCHASRLCR